MQTSGTVTSSKWRTEYLVSPVSAELFDCYTNDGCTSDDYTIQLQAKTNPNTNQLAKANPNIALEIN